MDIFRYVYYYYYVIVDILFKQLGTISELKPSEKTEGRLVLKWVDFGKRNLT